MITASSGSAHWTEIGDLVLTALVVIDIHLHFPDNLLF